MTHKPQFLTAFFSWFTDRSYTQLMGFWFASFVGFAVLYYLLTVFYPVHGLLHVESTTGWIVFFDSLYFSIVTATSTGYGDITPHGFSRVLASIQAIIALFVFASFVTKLVSYKQEMALREVHELTAGNMFSDVRQGLHTVRKDCDLIITKLHQHKALNQHDWDNLAVALKQSARLLQDIPNFYNEEIHLYSIDDTREELLLEATERTLHRLDHLMHTFAEYNISLYDHDESMAQLEYFYQVVPSILNNWHGYSPYNNHAYFEKLITLLRKLEQHKQ
jgi:hypothetical protein